jgi:hypothetical protein
MPSTNDSDEQLRRRDIAAVLGGAGLLAMLTGCTEETDEADPTTNIAEQSLTGVEIRWADTVLGALFPTSRSGGDLATLSGTAIFGSSSVRGVVIAKGCVTAGDGGGGIFLWEGSSTATDDGGTIIVPVAGGGSIGTVGNYWYRVYSGPRSVRYFGAKGNGTTVDDGAIQAAINSCATGGLNSSTTVYLPAGSYRISTPLLLATRGIRLVGDSEGNTTIAKTGSDSTCIRFSNAAAVLCEVSNLRFIPADGVSQTSGAAIIFDTPNTPGNHYVTAALLSRLNFEDVNGGIWCKSPDLAIGRAINEVTIRDIKMTRIKTTGIYLEFALNWTISDAVIQMNDNSANHFGVWLETWSEGCVFDSVFVLGGEHCWRFAKTRTPSFSTDRPPGEHRFYSCIGDNGSVSCFYASAMHRSIFDGCWASLQSPTASGAVVLDHDNVYGFSWVSGQIVNCFSHGFKVIKATSFSVVNSTFSDWGSGCQGTCPENVGILVSPYASMRFIISSNTFIGNDADFDPDSDGNAHTGIKVGAGLYSKYVIAHNVGYGLGAGGTVNDMGTASKSVTGNL